MNSSKTEKLEKRLQEISREGLVDFVNSIDHVDFRTYLKKCARNHGFSMSNVFERSDMPSGYGYKLLSGEKHTTRRDTILLMCIGGELTLDETQRVLKLYGMSPLYIKIERDAYIMKGIMDGIHKEGLRFFNDYLMSFDQRGIVFANKQTGE